MLCVFRTKVVRSSVVSVNSAEVIMLADKGFKVYRVNTYSSTPLSDFVPLKNVASMSLFLPGLSRTIAVLVLLH